MKKSFLLLVVALSACASAPVQHGCGLAGSTVPDAPGTLPSALPLVSAAIQQQIAHAWIKLDQAVSVRLHPDPEVVYTTLPQGAGEAASYGGLAGFRIDHAGRYLVGLGAAAWVDVSQSGRPLSPTCFGPGPVGSPARKVIGYQLQPGDYTLEISGNETESLRLEITKETG